MGFLDFQSSALPTELSCLNQLKYYARGKGNGKRVRARLERGVFSVAKLRLADKLKELRKSRGEVGTFTDGSVRLPWGCDIKPLSLVLTSSQFVLVSRKPRLSAP
jgi:hypothetical protein